MLTSLSLALIPHYLIKLQKQQFVNDFVQNLRETTQFQFLYFPFSLKKYEKYELLCSQSDCWYFDVLMITVFAKKYWRSWGCGGTNFTAAVKFANPKTEIHSENNQIQSIKIKLRILCKKLFFVSNKIACSQLIALVINYQLRSTEAQKRMKTLTFNFHNLYSLLIFICRVPLLLIHK